MAATRQGDAVWEGDLPTGRGKVTAATTGIFRDSPVTWAARTEAPEGKTSPEELLAAAHASCFAMQLSGLLGKQRTPPTRLEVTARVTFDKAGAGFRVTRSALEVRGQVPGLDEAGFRKVAEEAKEICPISGALKGNVELSVEAKLAG